MVHVPLSNQTKSQEIPGFLGCWCLFFTDSHSGNQKLLMDNRGWRGFHSLRKSSIVAFVLMSVCSFNCLITIEHVICDLRCVNFFLRKSKTKRLGHDFDFVDFNIIFR